MSGQEFETNAAPQPQQQHQRDLLLSNIAALRSRLDAKISAAKEQMEARLRHQVDDKKPVQQPLQQPQQQQQPPPQPAESRRELRYKIDRLRLDLDLLMARQRCLQERRKLQRLQQQQQQQQQQQLQQRKSRVPGVSPGRFSHGQRTAYEQQQRKPYATPRRTSWHRLNRSFGRFNSRNSEGTAVQTPLHKSRTLVERAKLRLRKRRAYCLFYGRFGYCRKAAGCQYLHDPKRIAICRRFLKHGGACPDPACRLSHCLDPDKLPLCEFFASGAGGCTRPGCPYRHTAYPAGTADCPNFARTGHCVRGVACPLRHVWPAEARAQLRRRRRRSLALARSGGTSAPKGGSGCPAFIPVPPAADDDAEDADDGCGSADVASSSMADVAAGEF